MEIVTLGQDAGTCVRQVLEELPDWFGNEEANDHYVAIADRSESTALAAMKGGELVGVLTLVRHFGVNCEVHVMGVRPNVHRSGAGRALIEAAIARAKDAGFRFLTVKTLADTHPSPHYAATRRFYRAMGFVEFEVLPELWGEDVPCLVMIQEL